MTAVGWALQKAKAEQDLWLVPRGAWNPHTHPCLPVRHGKVTSRPSILELRSENSTFCADLGYDETLTR